MAAGWAVLAVAEADWLGAGRPCLEAESDRSTAELVPRWEAAGDPPAGVEGGAAAE